MAAGETTTPILRSGAGPGSSNNNETTAFDGPGYYGAAYGQAAQPYSPYRSQNGGQEPVMQQINLASPPPPPLPANFKNADFF
jgi:hypothetical protein